MKHICEKCQKDLLKTQVKKIPDLPSLTKKEEFIKKELYTRKEVSHIFQVSTTTLHNWKKRKVLIPITIGGKIYYSRLCITNLIHQKLFAAYEESEAFKLAPFDFFTEEERKPISFNEYLKQQS